MLIYIKLLLTAFFWGGTFIAGRIIANEVPPFSAAFLRFTVASVLLLMLTWKVEGRIPKLKSSQIVPILLLGITGVFAYNVFFFKGLKLIQASRASLIVATNPIFITLLSSLLFKERLSILNKTGIALSVFGAMVVISKGNLGQILEAGAGWGDAYIFGCVVSWVLFSIIGKAILSDMTPLVSVAYSSVVGALALAIPAWMEGLVQHFRFYSLANWLGIVYLGVFGTVIGFVWYYQGIQRIGASRTGMFINLVPISSVVLAFWVLHEPITRSLAAGAILVSTGMFLTNRKPSSTSLNS